MPTKKIIKEKTVAVKAMKKEIDPITTIPEKIDIEFENKKENPYLIPISIVGAGLLIAIAILYRDPASLTGKNGSQPATDVMASIGLKKDAVESCLAKKAFTQKIQGDIADAEKAGGQGTPYNIVIAPSGKRFLIAGAYPYEDVKKIIEEALASTSTPPTAKEKTDPIYNMLPVSNVDHIRGNPNAPVKIVEFSDFECPFCQVFHETMKQVMTEYGEKGQVAWIYRHLPLTSIHRFAMDYAEESECASSIGGPNKFWEYADARFENLGK